MGHMIEIAKKKKKVHNWLTSLEPEEAILQMVETAKSDSPFINCFAIRNVIHKGSLMMYVCFYVCMKMNKHFWV